VVAVVRAGVDDDGCDWSAGTVQALKYDMFMDGGAATDNTLGDMDMAMLWADNLYYFPNYLAKVRLCDLCGTKSLGEGDCVMDMAIGPQHALAQWTCPCCGPTTSTTSPTTSPRFATRARPWRIVCGTKSLGGERSSEACQDASTYCPEVLLTHVSHVPSLALPCLSAADAFWA
jgi:hypothetical protein